VRHVVAARIRYILCFFVKHHLNATSSYVGDCLHVSLCAYVYVCVCVGVYLSVASVLVLMISVYVWSDS
jgi:hypothetical protein